MNTTENSITARVDKHGVLLRKDCHGVEYATRCGCTVDHGGSRRLYPSAPSGYYQCEGCSTSYAASVVVDAQRRERA